MQNDESLQNIDPIKLQCVNKHHSGTLLYHPPTPISRLCSFYIFRLRTVSKGTVYTSRTLVDPLELGYFIKIILIAKN